MNKEKDILKWFDDNISEEEMKSLEQTKDYTLLNKIKHYSAQLEAPKVNAEQALEQFKTKEISKSETKVKPLNFKSFYKIAAIFIIMLCGSYFMFFNNTKSFSTSIAQTKTFSLPDESEVILNATSKLSFNKKTWKDKRYLNLDGEAFFKVSKGNTFTVHTDAGNIQVLGTQFNVKERSNYFEVKCFEGSVAVIHKSDTATLKPGNTFRVINGNIIPTEDFNSKTPSWLNDETSFDNIPLAQVIDELERQYDIKIDASRINTSQLFTGTFTHNDKNIALQAVTIPLKLSYKIEKKNVILYQYGEKL